MILDKHRFQLWMDKADLPTDIKDTIEFFIDFDDVTKEFEELQKNANEIKDLKKEIEDLKSLKATKVAPPISRQSLSRYEAQGNSYPVKELLKRFGFRWDGEGKVWFLKDDGALTEKTVMEVRAQIKATEFDVNIVFCKGD